MCNDDSDDNLNCIYKITAQEQAWVDPTSDGRISWERESPYTLDSDKEIEQSQNWLHEVTTLNCNMMIRSLHCVTMEIRDFPRNDRLTMVDEFLKKFESEVLEW